MIFRTAEQKADLKGSFCRPDRPFFAAGGCHVLTQAFLDVAGKDDWQALIIVPHPGFRGTHVFAANDRYAFDYHGFTEIGRFRDHYFEKMNRWFTGWSADIIVLDISTTSEEFCATFGHRMSNKFYEDPGPRARAYVQRFEFPDDV